LSLNSVNIRLGWRLARLVLHLLQGLATCALVFPWAGVPLRERLVRRWSARLLRICRVEVERQAGADALQHALIVSNHISWLDIFVINSVHPCRFVAKAEIRAWPVLGWLVAQAGTVFIARGNRRDLRHIFKGLVDALAQHQRVAFFPEGTTASQGSLLPFHANLFEAAIDAKVPVQPVRWPISTRAGGWHPAVDYTGETTFVDSILRIIKGEPVVARLACLAPIDGGGCAPARTGAGGARCDRGRWGSTANRWPSDSTLAQKPSFPRRRESKFVCATLAKIGSPPARERRCVCVTSSRCAPGTPDNPPAAASGHPGTPPSACRPTRSRCPAPPDSAAAPGPAPTSGRTPR
jgi:1-acyl-sn-glycerol-3-phosphate acyltransferase